MGDCQVCEKHKTGHSLPGGFIFKDESIVVAHFPLIPSEKAHGGHIILEISRHITTPSELTEVEAASVGRWIPKISSALEKELGAEHIYIVRIGDKTPHLHFHFIPRYPNTPKEYWGPLLNTFAEGGPKIGAEEMIEITKRLRSYLKC